jgi:D-alanine-D-alanine ligase
LLSLGYRNVFLIDMDRHVDERLREREIEFAYLALLGRYGEDGCIQGMLEIMGIPYTGCRVAASAVAMNKDLTKRLLIERGLPVLPSVTFQFPQDADRRYDGPYPAVVKPVCEGSSIGIAIVQDGTELKAALEAAGKLDSQVMIEQYVDGRNLTVGVLDVDGEPRVTPIREMIPKDGWYDYEAKYTDGKADFVCPANLAPDLTEAIQKVTLETNKALNCRGLSRTDYMLGADNRFYVLEVNTIPALTRHANFPAQVEAMGLTYAEMVEAILKTASLDASVLIPAG